MVALTYNWEDHGSRPCLQNNYSKMDSRCGSRDRKLALQAPSPEFKLQSQKKKKKDYQLQLKTHCVLELIKASPHQNNFDYKEFDRS
jgi:hypothetical protein